MGKTFNYRSVTCISCDISYQQLAVQRRELCPQCFEKVHRCIKCTEIKPHEEFGLDKSSNNGRQRSCKKCINVSKHSTCRKCGIDYYRKSRKDLKKLCPACRVDFNWCHQCETHKTVENFAKNSSRANGLDPRCRECKRNNRLEREYGVDIQEYERMFAEQGGLCAICHRPPPENRPILCVDHCHRTGMVRGLLCGFCNTSIGYLQDDVPTILRAATYVFERSPAIDESEISTPDKAGN